MEKKEKKAKLPKMTVNIRSAVAMGILVVLVALLTAYNRYSVRSAQNVAMLDELSGQRIGTIIGWESDILLSDRDDVTLMRYDTLSECVVALTYHQIDAIGMDMGVYSASMQMVDGIEKVGEPLTRMGGTVLVSPTATENGVLEELNQFAKDFQESDDYQEYLDRVFFANGEEEFETKEIPVVENGKPLSVCYFPEYYPSCYLDTVTGEPVGTYVEFIQRFAYACGYTITFTQESELGAFRGLKDGTYDISVAATTDTYREDIEESGYAHMSEPFYYSDVYMIHVKDGEKVTLSGTIIE